MAYSIIFYSNNRYWNQLAIYSDIIDIQLTQINFLMEFISISSIALSVSVITTGILTIHDTLRKADHVRGFMRYLLSQNVPTGAQYAITVVTTALEERVTTKGEQLKNKINTSSEFISQQFQKLQNEVQKTLNNINADSMINYLKDRQRQKANQEKISSEKNQSQVKNGDKRNLESKGIWETIMSYKDAISQEINVELEQYQSLKSQKIQKALLYLYGQYKLEKGIYNDKFITPYNIIMLVLLGIGSFLLPKLTIILGISYLISGQIYLLSDTITKATKTQKLKNLKFENIFYFHLGIFAAAFSFNRYNFYKQSRMGLFALHKNLSATI